jgi:hypothetical protein
LLDRIGEEAENLILAKRKQDRWYGGLAERGSTRSLREEFGHNVSTTVSDGRSALGEAAAMQLLLRGSTPECASLSVQQSGQRFGFQARHAIFLHSSQPALALTLRFPDAAGGTHSTQ